MTHRWMECRREEERDSGMHQAALDDRRWSDDVDAELLEQVGTAAPARHGAVAMLGHAHTCGRDDERGDGRDVERVSAIAASAAGVEHVRGDLRQLCGTRAHRTRQADDL